MVNPLIPLALGGIGAASSAYSASKLGDVQTVPRLGVGRAFGLPRLLQYRAYGGDLAPLRISGREFRSLPKGEGIRLGRGKNRQYFRSPTVEDTRSQARAFERRRIEDERNSLRELQNSPLYDSLLGDAQGTTSRFAQSILELGRRSLGGAAASGLNVRDAGVQARVLGQNALQGYLAQRGLQRQAGMTGLSLVRGPGTPGGALAPQSLGQLQAGVMQQYGMDLGAAGANVSAGNQANAVQAGMYGKLGGGLMNAATMLAMMGGGQQPEPTPGSGSYSLGYNQGTDQFYKKWG